MDGLSYTQLTDKPVVMNPKNTCEFYETWPYETEPPRYGQVAINLNNPYLERPEPFKAYKEWEEERVLSQEFQTMTKSMTGIDIIIGRPVDYVALAVALRNNGKQMLPVSGIATSVLLGEKNRDGDYEDRVFVGRVGDNNPRLKIQRWFKNNGLQDNGKLMPLVVPR